MNYLSLRYCLPHSSPLSPLLSYLWLWCHIIHNLNISGALLNLEWLINNSDIEISLKDIKGVTFVWFQLNENPNAHMYMPVQLMNNITDYYKVCVKQRRLFVKVLDTVIRGPLFLQRIFSQIYITYIKLLSYS